jgi:hypothetical protein
MVLLIVILEVYYHQGNVVLASVVNSLLGECFRDLTELHALTSQLNDFASHVFFWETLEDAVCRQDKKLVLRSYLDLTYFGLGRYVISVSYVSNGARNRQDTLDSHYLPDWDDPSLALNDTLVFVDARGNLFTCELKHLIISN